MGGRETCQAFTKDGLDNGKLTVIEGQTEWGNSGVGHYTLGDFMYAFPAPNSARITGTHTSLC